MRMVRRRTGFSSKLPTSRGFSILGAQALFGFAFEGAFQDGFPSLPALSQALHCGSLVPMLSSIGLLIMPSMIHQVVYAGEDRTGMARAMRVQYLITTSRSVPDSAPQTSPTRP